jgi:hypothetical protein
MSNRRKRVAGELSKVLWFGDAPGGNYTEDLSAKVGRVPRGTAASVTVAHDAWCAMMRKGLPCNCNPVVSR